MVPMASKRSPSQQQAPTVVAASPHVGSGRRVRSTPAVVGLVLGGFVLVALSAFVGVRLAVTGDGGDTSAGAHDVRTNDRSNPAEPPDDGGAANTVGTTAERRALEPSSSGAYEDDTSLPIPATTFSTSTTLSLTPGQELGFIRDADRPRAEQLVERWVPQVSSKWPGLEDKRTHVIYDDQMILDYHQSLADRYGALLLWSGDYTTFKNPAVWVSVVPQPFPTKEGAKEWCDETGLDPDNCFAKLLSHTHGTEDSTGLR